MVQPSQYCQTLAEAASLPSRAANTMQFVSLCLAILFVSTAVLSAGINRSQSDEINSLETDYDQYDVNETVAEANETMTEANETWHEDGEDVEDSGEDYFKFAHQGFQHRDDRNNDDKNKVVNVPSIKISEINVKTYNSKESDLDENGDIDLEIFGDDFSCTIKSLDNPNIDDFESGSVNIFQGRMLGGCEGQNMTKPISFVRVIHYGEDAWGLDWLKIVYNDEKEQICRNPEPYILLENSAVELDCTLI